MKYQKLHDAAMAVIKPLMVMDPAPESLEGKLLLALAEMIEELEKEAFPF